MLFDKDLYKKRIKRYKLWQYESNFLLPDISLEVIDRLAMVNRCFETVLVLGDYTGVLTKDLQTSLFDSRDCLHNQKKRVGHIIRQNILCSDQSFDKNGYQEVVMDEDDLCFVDKKFDAIISFLNMQFINDLPQHLMDIMTFLKPDGLLLSCFVGGESLKTLRHAFMKAEMECMGGVSPRVIPFVDIRSFGDLLNKIGYKMIVTDIEKHVYDYKNFYTILQDIKRLGWANNLVQRSTKNVKKSFFDNVKKHYETYKNPHDKIPRYQVEYDIVWASCWSAGPNQPQPLKPGSAKVSLTDALSFKNSAIYKNT